jgi:hypothetical protein
MAGAAVVHGDQVGAPAHAALGRRLQTVQSDEARRQRQPAAIGMELLLQVGDRPADAIRERLAGIAHVVEPRTVMLLRHDPPYQIGESPADCLGFVAPVAFDRDPIEDGEARAVHELRAHPRHRLGAGRQLELVGIEVGQRTEMLARYQGDLVELRGARIGYGHLPSSPRQQLPLPAE